MYLSRHEAAGGPRWALDGRYLPPDFTLRRLLAVEATDVRGYIEEHSLQAAAEDPLSPPVETEHEVWASGVTYVQSRDAREMESADADAYAFGLNAVGDGLHVFMPTGAVHLREAIAGAGYLPVEIDLSELLLGGGSVKCCTQEIRPTPEGSRS